MKKTLLVCLLACACGPDLLHEVPDQPKSTMVVVDINTTVASARQEPDAGPDCRPMWFGKGSSCTCDTQCLSGICAGSCPGPDETGGVCCR
jgi:hypothetical protein